MKAPKPFGKIPALLLMITAVSCQEVIDIELNNPDNQRIVVEGRLTNELKRHTIRLTHTLSYFDSQLAPPVMNAEVYLIEEGTGTRVNFTQIDNEFGLYQSDQVKGRVGETYSLFVNDGDDSYKATSYLDTVAQMDSINYKYEFDSYENFGYYIIRMSAYEPPPMGNTLCQRYFL
jgi:hypothetical protein